MCKLVYNMAIQLVVSMLSSSPCCRYFFDLLKLLLS